MFHFKKTPEKPKINPLSSVYLSILSILLSMACLAGSSLAWFSATQTYPMDAITSARWSIQSVTLEDGTPLSQDTQGAWTFIAQANHEYHLTITPTGTATTGYVLIHTPDGSYYAKPGKGVFTICIATAGQVTITPQWGPLPQEATGVNEGYQVGLGRQQEVESIADPTETTPENTGFTSETPDSTSENPDFTPDPTAPTSENPDSASTPTDPTQEPTSEP